MKVPERILISGSTGFIGSRLAGRLRAMEYEVRELSRSGSKDGVFQWDPEVGYLDTRALADVDAVVHLAGENIASGRWTTSRKKGIRNSRIQGTRLLVDKLSGLDRKPSVLISASGVNIYEKQGFLASVCQDWEAEALRAEESGIRTACVRTGIVLDPEGGALKKMLPAFRLGLGGPVGSGTQVFPWIPLDDLLNLYMRILEDSVLQGPINAVHPEQISQAEFARALGHVLGRPAKMPLPAWVVKLFFGEMGKETLLASPRVEPGILEQVGHHYMHPSLDAFLESQFKGN
jgi:uncharacterized protein (TIGR01777 family)